MTKPMSIPIPIFPPVCPQPTLYRGSHPGRAQRNRKAKMANFTIFDLLLLLLAIFPLTIFLHNFGPFFEHRRGMGSSGQWWGRGRGRRTGLNSRRFVCFRLFFEAFLNGLFMRGRSIIHTLYYGKVDGGRVSRPDPTRPDPARPDQTG